ncbi:MAG: NAD(P)/FAD-dependent oxidoreductase, partial [Gammaproteobacteria bacterium]|nr:NAD(P)/FAD-dependent oxidoreductase [Gammaproteobacteria bacterium]
DPKTTFLKLVGARNIETGFARRVDNIRMQGKAAKLHLALQGLPEFNGIAETQLGNRLIIAPSLNYVEQAFDHSKYGEYSNDPAMEISIPSMLDDSLAPSGKHVLSAIVQYAPYELRAGWESQRDTFKNLLIEKLAEYAPGIKDQIIASELLVPPDIEKEFHIHGGHWHHGEYTLDQFMMLRPVPGAAQYSTPVDGLYLCGAGSHPGGGVMGLAGRNASTEILNREDKS